MPVSGGQGVILGFRLALAASQGVEFFPELHRRVVHGRSHAHCGRRAERSPGLGQRRVAEREAHAIDGHTERLGGDLGHDGIGACADLLAAGLDQYLAVGPKRDSGVRGKAERRHDRRRHSPSDEIVAFAQASGARIAPRPAEPLGALHITLAQLLRRERFALRRIDLGVIAESELERVHLQRHGELVHRNFQRNHARPFVRRAHCRGCAAMHAHRAVTRGNRRGGVQGAGARRRVFHVVVRHRASRRVRHRARLSGAWRSGSRAR